MKKIELLAPAGSYESLVAAVNAGCDAVYIGGSKFGARAYAKNPKEDMLIEGIKYAHHFGVKIYMTVNTLLKEDEINTLVEYLTPYYMAGMDAFIVQDIGVFDLIKSNFPNIEIHISTQMSLMGTYGAKLIKNLGADRIVPARELSLKEIKNIRDNVDIDIETFVYGALCYAYSGQCLMSSMLGGRSANRGRCAGTCRLNYELYDKKNKLNTNKEKTLLSCKDLCSLDMIPNIIKAGVNSFKIEGRMKSAIYTAGVVSIWRKYIDIYEKFGENNFKIKEKDRKLLLDLFDRGGQTDGYYQKHNAKDMIVFDKEKTKNINENYNKYLEDTFVNVRKKLKLYFYIRIKKDEKINIFSKVLDNYFSDDEFFETLSINLIKDEPDLANKHGATKEDIEKQILKTGNSFYEIDMLEIELDEGLFIPVKLLNDIRREVLDKLDEKILLYYSKNRKVREKNISDNILVSNNIIESKKIEFDKEKPYINIVCEYENQLKKIINICKKDLNGIGEISFTLDNIDIENIDHYVNEIRKLGLKVNLYMPHIFRTHSIDFFKKYQDNIFNSNFDNIIIRSLEELVYIAEYFNNKTQKMPNILFDYNLYGMNSIAQNMNYKLGAKRQMLPLELNLKELHNINTQNYEILVYGNIPMMVSAQCLRKNSLGCDKKLSVLTLKDRYNKMMPVKNSCRFCYNTIYNSQVLSTLGISENIKKLNVRVYRLWFTLEKDDEIEAIINKYRNLYICNKKEEEISKDFTRGHYKRGIE